MVLPTVTLDVVSGMRLGGINDQFCLNISPAAYFQQVAGYYSLPTGFGESFKTSVIISSIN